MTVTSGPQSVVAVLSGGLDSTTMVYDALNRDIQVKRLISFNYGQRHKRELIFASKTAFLLNLPHTTIDLWSSGLTEALLPSGSALITDTRVPDGHYSEGSMKATVVPNRNMIMIAIAGGIAVAENVNAVLIGVHSGDHAIYPDCRPHFIETVGHALVAGNIGFGSLDQRLGVLAPYIDTDKAHIARIAFELGVPLEDTWSCYKGGDVHCGRCGTCVERLEAIAQAKQYFRNKGMDAPVDRTEYADKSYWKKAVSWEES